LSGGGVYAASGSSASDDFTNGGIGARAGFGLNIRASKSFAIQPEVTGLRFFHDVEGPIVIFGLGFNFGALPSYAPGSEDGAPREDGAL
jgi:hypothetical protein